MRDVAAMGHAGVGSPHVFVKLSVQWTEDEFTAG